MPDENFDSTKPTGKKREPLQQLIRACRGIALDHAEEVFASIKNADRQSEQPAEVGQALDAALAVLVDAADCLDAALKAAASCDVTVGSAGTASLTSSSN